MLWSAIALATLTVSAAASLSDVLNDLAKRFEAASGVRVQINAAASNTLARQIVDGAPVDVFISADEAQMTAAETSGRIAKDTRVALLSNHLVIVVPQDVRNAIDRPADLATSRIRRVAMGQPDSVPAGVYGRMWLETLGLWASVKPKLVPMATVRAALAAVREGRADAGIVYATDALTTRAVRIVYRVPPGDGPRIVYPAAALAGPNEADARRFLAYLQSPEARRVFEAAGFSVPAR
jgi:molybdate transport system substrate-binding protein